MTITSDRHVSSFSPLVEARSVKIYNNVYVRGQPTLVYRGSNRILRSRDYLNWANIEFSGLPGVVNFSPENFPNTYTFSARAHGDYDSIKYTWSKGVGPGTLTQDAVNPYLAVYDGGAVTEDINVKITCVVTASGDGTTAKAGTIAVPITANLAAVAHRPRVLTEIGKIVTGNQALSRSGPFNPSSVTATGTCRTSVVSGYLVCEVPACDRLDITMGRTGDIFAVRRFYTALPSSVSYSSLSRAWIPSSRQALQQRLPWNLQLTQQPRQWIAFRAVSIGASNSAMGPLTIRARQLQ